MQLRNAADQIECHYAKISGSGNSRVLTLITLGGQAVVDNWELQCDPDNYESLPNYMTQPYCSSFPGTRIAVNSTVITRVNYQGGGEPDTSSAVAHALSALGMLAAGAMYTLA